MDRGEKCIQLYPHWEELICKNKHYGFEKVFFRNPVFMVLVISFLK